MKILPIAKKFSFLGILLIIAFAFFYFGLNDYLTIDTLKKYQDTAEVWTETHYFTAVVIYIAVFALLIACAIPCATILTLLGGFLFGNSAILYALIGPAIGGTVLFHAARLAFGSLVAAKRSGWIKKMEQGFQENAFNYIIMLRLVAILPCWVTNISSGALNVPFLTFISATFIGLLPSTVIYVLAGQSLDKLLASKVPVQQIIFTPSILLPLLALAILSLFPVIYRWVKIRNNRTN